MKTVQQTSPTHIHVRKAHGALNDVVVIDGAPEAHGFYNHEAVSAFVQALSDRANSLGGADGVYFVDRSSELPIAKYYNSDGTAAEYCGNGLRCVGRYLLEATGEKQATVISGGTTFEVSRLPTADHGTHNISVRALDGLAVKSNAAQLSIDRVDLNFTLVLAPNPHLVAVVGLPEARLGVDDLLLTAAQKVRRQPSFAAGVNVSLAVCHSHGDTPSWIIRTDERGVGLTSSCASGAVAAVATLVTLGYEQLDREVIMRNVGGPIAVCVEERDGALFPTQSGNATWVLDSTVSVANPSVANSPTCHLTFGNFTTFDDELSSAKSLYWNNASYLREVGVEVKEEEFQARANPRGFAG